MTELSYGELVERQLEVASLSGEVQSVMEGIVERLLELPHADGASLSTVEDGIAHFTVSVGADAPLQDQRLPLENTLGAECADTGEVQVLRGSTGSDMARSLTADTGTIVLAPIVYDGATRGVLGVRSRLPDAFGELEVETTRLLAQSAAIALRNAGLLERLAASERGYRELHAQAADAILVSDLEGNITDANAAAAALFWYPVAELRTMNATSLLDPAELASEPLRQAELRERRELRAERTFRRKDGATIDIEYSCRVLDDGRVHTTLRDVTQRKRNDERLRASLDQLQAIIQTQQEISALELDPVAVTRAIVERAQRLTGADGAAVEWLDREVSVIRVGSGVAKACVGLRVDRAASLAGLATTLGAAVYAADTATDPRVDAEACRILEARSLICAPLHRNGVVIGVLTIVARQPNAFDELAIETTRLMAEFVSTVMRNSTELETRRTLVEELRTQGQVVEHMQTALWVWALEADGSFRLEHANAASEMATGLAAETVLGRTIREVLPALQEEMIERFRAVVESNTFFDGGEVEYADDRIAPSVFSLKAFPLSGRRVAVTFENITEAAGARRAVQESEARFRGAFHAASVGMALTALDGTFVLVNERLAEMLGYTVDELTGLSVRAVTHPEELSVDLESLEQLRSGEIDSYHCERRYLRKDGSTVWGDLTASLVRLSDGEPTHMVAHVQDVTERRLVEHALAEREAFLSTMFDTAPQCLKVVTAECELVEMNLSGLAMIEAESAEEVVGKSLLPLVKEGYREQFAELHRRAAAGSGGTLTFELRGLRGGERTLRTHVEPLRKSDKPYVLGITEDITDQRRLEEQLRQAQKMEAVGRLAGGIAHDFNNLLTAISGYSEFLIAELDDERQRRHADEIRKAAARAASLTGQLLAFSRRQMLQPRVLDLNAVVSDMDMMLRRLIGEDVELVALLDSELGAVQADPTQIEQVIVNLAVNARDAMPHGGSLTIETANVETEDGPAVELRMTDTGTGMTDSEREQLFDPFFTTKAGGTGLGLATVYGVVEQSGGTIEVDSAPGMGSSFRICLPRASTPAEPPAPRHVPDIPARGNETVLLVEDELVVRQLVAEILETSGYAVLQAGDGPSGLELLRRHSDPIDLLLTDVVMPGMSGPEIAQAVTSMRPGTQVLYMSGYTDSAIGHHGVLEPGIAFLQKPFSADDLTRKVRALLDEPAHAPVD